MTPLLLSLASNTRPEGQGVSTQQQGLANLLAGGAGANGNSENAQPFQALLATIKSQLQEHLPEQSIALPSFVTPTTLSETVSSLDLQSQSPGSVGVAEALNNLMQRLRQALHDGQGDLLDNKTLEPLRAFEQQLGAVLDKIHAGELSPELTKDIHSQLAEFLPLLAPVLKSAGIQTDEIASDIKSILEKAFRLVGEDSKPAGRHDMNGAPVEEDHFHGEGDVDEAIVLASPGYVAVNIAQQQLTIQPGQIELVRQMGDAAAKQPAALLPFDAMRGKAIVADADAARSIVKPELQTGQAMLVQDAAAGTDKSVQAQAQDAAKQWGLIWQDRQKAMQSNTANTPSDIPSKKNESAALQQMTPMPLAKDFVATQGETGQRMENSFTQQMMQPHTASQNAAAATSMQPAFMPGAEAQPVTTDSSQPITLMSGMVNAEESAARSDTAHPAKHLLPNQHAQPAEQVKVHIRQALNDGVDRIQVKLDPAELGKLEVRMDVNKDGRTHILITAEKQDTLDLLQRDSRDLIRSLQNMGVKADSGGMEFSLKGDGQGGFGNQSDNPQGNNNGSQQFSLSDTGNGTQLAEHTADSGARHLITDSALDISV